MNKNLKILLICWIVSLVVCAIGSGLITHYYIDKPITAGLDKPVVKPIITNKIDRTKNISLPDCSDKLYHYDHDLFLMKYKIISQSNKELNVKVTGSLYERNFEQSVYFPIRTESGNWKMGLGFTLGTCATIGTGILIYNIIKQVNKR